MALGVHALTKFETVRDELGLSGTGDQTVIERLINAASEAIERFCQRHFERDTAIVEDLKGFGDERLVIRQPPLNTITSIETRDYVTGTLAAIDSTEFEVEDSEGGLIFRRAGWAHVARRRPDIAQDKLPGSEERYIRVTYDGGFDLPKTGSPPAGGTALPADLEQAAIDMAVALFRRRGQDAGVVSERLLSGAQTFADERRALLPAVQQLLEPHVRLPL